MTTKKNDNLPAKAPETAVTLAGDFGDHAGVGGQVEMDDLLIPFAKLIQKDSKECDESEETYLPDAQPGLICNKATEELYPEVRLVPVLKRKTFTEWMPNLGGFVAEHAPDSPVVREALASGAPRHELKHGDNDLVETQNLFCVVVDEDDNPTGDYLVVPFSSSKLKVWRGYWTKVNKVMIMQGEKKVRLTDVAPIYSHRIALGSFDDKNKAGKKYKNYTMVPAVDANVQESLIYEGHPAFEAGAMLRQAILSGSARADYETAAEEGDGSGGARKEAF